MPLITCLGIESTADNLGIGIASSDGIIHTNIVDVHIPEEGGIHPREAARHHSEKMGDIIRKALNHAEIEKEELDLIAFSQGPGLGPCLRTGATGARAIASYLKLPLVGVNHCIAHIEIGRLTTKSIDPLTLYVSGGNTIVSAYESGKYRIFGETLDIAVGNLLDAFARDADLEYPGGPAVEKYALQGKNLVSLPYIVKGMDLSYSGLLTSIKKKLHSGKYKLHDLCFSLQETAYAMLGEITERALAHTGKEELLLTGGVGVNKRLRNIIGNIATEHGAKACFVPIEYATDNGAMIAWTGILAYKVGITTKVDTSYVYPNWRMDQVEVPWRKKD